MASSKSIRAPLIAVFRRRIVKESHCIEAVCGRRTVPIHFDVTNVSIYKTDDITSVVEHGK